MTMMPWNMLSNIILIYLIKMEVIKEIKTIHITKYKADDGKIFNTKQECIDYEKQCLEQETTYKAIECKNIYDPFALWHSEPNISRLYILKSNADYEALKAHFIDKVDDCWEEPERYPAVMAVFFENYCPLAILWDM